MATTLELPRSRYNAADAWAAFNGLYCRAAKAAEAARVAKAAKAAEVARRAEFIRALNAALPGEVAEVARAANAVPPANPPRPGKREQQHLRKQLKKKIQQDWKRIALDHPDDHVLLKLELGVAIRRTATATRLVERASSTINAQRASDPVEIYEDLIKAQMRALTAWNKLGVVGSRVGGAANSIVEHADREIALLKANIKLTGEHVAAHRREVEGDGYGRTERRDAFQANSQPTPPHGGRQWRQHIGAGPLSCVGLCLSGDEHNRIVDRYVMKDVWFTDMPDLWTHKAFWYGDPLDPTSKVPYEVHIMARLSRLALTAAGHENVLRMRAWHMAPEKLMYRILMEYCPNGEVNRLLEYHWALNMNNRYQNSQQPDSYIPEPAIWHIFNSLVKAGLSMEQVSVDKDDPFHDQRLGEVVHLDIKPENVFLGDYPPNDPDAHNNFAMYPTCKLADFGLSTYQSLAKKSHVRKKYIERGTPRYFAPESKPEYHGKHRPHLNAKTNVWGVGITVMALMNLDGGAGYLQFQEAADDELDPSLVPDFMPAAVAQYSDPLRNMVRACLQYRQDDRPSFKSLLGSLQCYTGLAPGRRDRAEGARFGTRDALPAGLTLLDGLPVNKYALGMAVPT